MIAISIIAKVFQSLKGETMTNEEAIEYLKNRYMVMSMSINKEECLKNNEAR